jgi:hypothetical protein
MVASARIRINRAPVLTLWATVVAERLGYKPDEALTLGRAVAAYNAQSKGRRLGIYEPVAETKEEQPKSRRKKRQIPTVKLLNRTIPIAHTEEGIRALIGSRPDNPKTVRRYLESKFGDALVNARSAMAELADAYTHAELEKMAYRLYEEFRPEVPSGTKGWGAAGELDLQKIRSLVE